MKKLIIFLLLILLASCDVTEPPEYDYPRIKIQFHYFKADSTNIKELK
jgi:hypothetical protein